MRLLRVLPPVAVSLLMLTGCAAPFTVCSTIGYGSVAHLELADPRPDLDLELCDGAGCVPGPVELPVEIGSAESPVPTGVFELTGTSSDGWSASLSSGLPTLGYRLTDSSGIVIAEGAVEADWVRIDGTEQCGGNRTARVMLPSG